MNNDFNGVKTISSNAKANTCSACPLGTYSMPGFCSCMVTQPSHPTPTQTHTHTRTHTFLLHPPTTHPLPLQNCPCGTTTTIVGSTVCTAISGSSPCACATTALAVTQYMTGVSLTQANQPAFQTAFIGTMVTKFPTPLLFLYTTRLLPKKLKKLSFPSN